MYLSVVILPVNRWPVAREQWRHAEELGFRTAWTYDHLTWRSFREGPWFGAVPTLTAAAAVTDRIRLGTMVTSPNFRHPVTLAKDVVAIDDVSGGRLTLGVGAGGAGFDATALGQERWTPRERADRFEEFVPMVDTLLTEPAATVRGRFWTANDVRTHPGCVQRPRVPMYVAATGPRGMALAAAHGQGWITYGHPRTPADVPVERCPDVVAGQIERLGAACAAIGRDPGELAKVLLQGSTAERPLDSLEAFVDYAGRHREVGVTEIAIHWPIPGTDYDADPRVFELIATEAMDRLGEG